MGQIMEDEQLFFKKMGKVWTAEELKEYISKESFTVKFDQPPKKEDGEKTEEVADEKIKPL